MKFQNPFAQHKYYGRSFFGFRVTFHSRVPILIFLLLISLAFVACDSGPRVIEAASPETLEVSESSIPAFESVPDVTFNAPKNNSAEHEVIVEETLDTEKYSYLQVKEGEEKFWIAISKRDISVGETYIYKGGLLKRNFFSREFNRVFETVYLVSNIRKKINPNSTASNGEMAEKIPVAESLPDLKVEKIEPTSGAISLADLFSNMPDYNGQTIKITGKCMKVNPKIMNRNWIHIQDGSGENLDLTVTTMENIPLGAVVSLEGKIALDKDFGAGYRYDIIMEEAVMK